MRSKIVSSIVLIAAFFTPFAFSQTPSAAPAALKVAAAATTSATAAPPRGTLYRVANGANTAYLFGTIHVGHPSFYPLEARVTDALTQASKLVVELDPRDHASLQAALLKHGSYGPNETLRDHVSADTMARLEKLLAQYGLSTENVLRMKPWMIANLLLGLALEHHGYQRSFGLEFHLLNAAGQQAKPVLELESAELQLSLFDTMTRQEQEQYLRENLEELSDGRAVKKARDLIDAWSRADKNKFEALMLEASKDKSKTAEFTQRVLLDKRNPNMADKIEALLKTDKATFVGVGLLHLMGDTGLPALLRQRGYLVEKLY